MADFIAIQMHVYAKRRDIFKKTQSILKDKPNVAVSGLPPYNKVIVSHCQLYVPDLVLYWHEELTRFEADLAYYIPKKSCKSHKQERIFETVNTEQELESLLETYIAYHCAIEYKSLQHYVDSNFDMEGEFIYEDDDYITDEGDSDSEDDDPGLA